MCSSVVTDMLTVRRIENILLGIIGLTGTAAFLVLFNKYGIGVSPDSVTYISVARNLLQGNGFTCYDGYAYVLQAPLYPVLLAFISKMCFADPLQCAAYFNAVLFGLIISYTGVVVRKLTLPGGLSLLGSASVLFSYVLVQTFLIALSEPLFILFVLVFLHALNNYIEKGSLSALLLVAVAVLLACLTRYVGIIIIITGSVSILVWGKNKFFATCRHLLLFWLITLLPTGVWLIRNYFLSGTLVGQRSASSYSLSDNWYFLFRTFTKWFTPYTLTGQEIMIRVVIVLLILAGLIVYLSRQKQARLQLGRIGPAMIFMALYSGIIVISSTTTAYDRIDHRLLSPVYIPMLLVLFFFLTIAYKWLAYYCNEILLSAMLLMGIGSWISYQREVTYFSLESFIQQSGNEYNGRAWKASPVIQYLNDNPEIKQRYSFYSNVPEAVYLLAHVETKWSPPKTLYNSPTPVKMAPSLRTIWFKKEAACIVWFDNMDRHFLYTIEELQKSANLIKIAELPDGSIYTITEK